MSFMITNVVFDIIKKDRKSVAQSYKQINAEEREQATAEAIKLTVHQDVEFSELMDERMAHIQKL